MKKALKAAFPHTLPVMLGYVFVGGAFGLLFQQMGYGVFWSFLVGLTVYAGAGQFVALNFFAGGFGFLEMAVMTFMVNVRYMFYGISFIDRFRKFKSRRPYLIWTLTDETYSLLCSVKVPPDITDGNFCTAIALLDQCYWLIGCVVGNLAGNLLTFDTTGIDFAMTGMFIVIFVEQWLSFPAKAPALIGVGSTLAALFLFGPEGLIFPAMLLMAVLLLGMRRPLEKKLEQKEGQP